MAFAAGEHAARHFTELHLFGRLQGLDSRIRVELCGPAGFG
jgi:hypothetical protein